jgi:hypothetical protein
MHMANMYMNDSYSAVRQADGKVLGRVRAVVKSATPQAGVKDFRFFVDPVSPLPKGFDDGEKFGFTGFMSRIGFGYNSFADEESALANLESVFGDCFVSFTPSLRNNRYFVLDDMVKEAGTPFMEEDRNYYPVPAFGTEEMPVFDGDINKFCHHLLTDRPLPGLSKRYWNNDVPPRLIVAATRNYENKIGPWVVFAPLYDEAFDSRVIGEGGAYFRVKNRGQLGYAVVDGQNSELSSHILRCAESPLWFVPEVFLADLRLNLKPVPRDADLLKDCGVAVNPFADEMDEEEPGHEVREQMTQKALDDLVQSLGIGASSEEAYAPRRNRRDPRLSHEAEAIEKAPAFEEMHQEPAAPVKERPKAFTEADFLARLKEAAENDGLLYAEKDLFHFHISMKSSRLVILAGKSGIGKSGLVRLYGRALGLPEAQVRFLPVRPSWMDDGDVLGYVDMKNMVYRSADTGLAELLIDAAAHLEKQYIVCFDEMNLARVEHYFAQFISVLEKEDHPMIRLYNPSLAPRLYNSEKYPPEIPVGSNVLFTGTVNVDESTCHFSDKILDRANVITLSQCHFRDLLKLKPQERKAYKEITAKAYDDFRVKEGMGLNDQELDLLDALNDAFTKSGMPYGIGFRVAQQMGRYLENIPEEAGISRGEGLDAQLVQRVFTKLRGSADQLSILLSLSDKNTAEGLLPAILVRFKALSDFQGSQAVLKRKAGELKLYDYTM